MEVHHHPDLHHKKKNFKEYFLEFLMIFLAVTLGFFAESYREYLNNLSKENEYMTALVEDLKSDTSFLQLSIHQLIPYHLNGWILQEIYCNQQSIQERTECFIKL